MKHSNTLAGFLGIAQIDYGSSFDNDEPDNIGGDEPATTVTPCTGLLLISDNSLIDVGGNVYGTCNDDSNFSDINADIIDNCDSMSLTNNTDISSTNDVFCDTYSIDDCSTFPDDSWSDW